LCAIYTIGSGRSLGSHITRRGRPATLPYVLRSFAVHADITELVTVGEHPVGVTPDRHIDSPNKGKPHQNVAGHLRRVASELGGSFVWCDDDTFALRPWAPAVYVRPFSIGHMLRKNPNAGHWSHAVRASVKVLEAWGYDPDEVPCGTVHRPWLVDSARVLTVVDALDAVGGGSFKALYVAGLADTVAVEDHKLRGRDMPKPDADVVSVFHDSWRYNAGRIIREKFPDPSRWETPTQNDGMALSASGRVRGPRRPRK
jgi:hypothetical protein